jgi:virulence-associated protein VapD
MRLTFRTVLFTAYMDDEFYIFEPDGGLSSISYTSEMNVHDKINLRGVLKITTKSDDSHKCILTVSNFRPSIALYAHDNVANVKKTLRRMQSTVNTTLHTVYTKNDKLKNLLVQNSIYVTSVTIQFDSMGVGDGNVCVMNVEFLRIEDLEHIMKAVYNFYTYKMDPTRKIKIVFPPAVLPGWIAILQRQNSANLFEYYNRKQITPYEVVHSFRQRYECWYDSIVKVARTNTKCTQVDQVTMVYASVDHLIFEKNEKFAFSNPNPQGR